MRQSHKFISLNFRIREHGDEMSTRASLHRVKCCDWCEWAGLSELLRAEQGFCRVDGRTADPGAPLLTAIRY